MQNETVFSRVCLSHFNRSEFYDTFKKEYELACGNAHRLGNRLLVQFIEFHCRICRLAKHKYCLKNDIFYPLKGQEILSLLYIISIKVRM